MIIGPELFTFALGSQWATAGVYAQIITPWIFVAFISTPLMSIFNVLEMQGANFWFNILLLITRVGCAHYCRCIWRSRSGLVLLSATGIIFWGWMNMYTLKIAGVPVRDEIYEIIRYLLFGTLVCLPLIIAKYYSVSTILLIIIALVLAAVYYSVIISRDIQLKQGLFSALKNILQKSFDFPDIPLKKIFRFFIIFKTG